MLARPRGHPSPWLHLNIEHSRVCIAINALVCLLDLVFCPNTFFLHHTRCNKHEGGSNKVGIGTMGPSSFLISVPKTSEYQQEMDSIRRISQRSIEIATNEIDSRKPSALSTRMVNRSHTLRRLSLFVSEYELQPINSRHLTHGF